MIHHFFFPQVSKISKRVVTSSKTEEKKLIINPSYMYNTPYYASSCFSSSSSPSSHTLHLKNFIFAKLPSPSPTRTAAHTASVIVVAETTITTQVHFPDAVVDVDVPPYLLPPTPPPPSPGTQSQTPNIFQPPPSFPWCYCPDFNLLANTSPLVQSSPLSELDASLTLSKNIFTPTTTKPRKRKSATTTAPFVFNNQQ